MAFRITSMDELLRLALEREDYETAAKIRDWMKDADEAIRRPPVKGGPSSGYSVRLEGGEPVISEWLRNCSSPFD